MRADGRFVYDTHFHIYGPMQTIWGHIGQMADRWIERMDSNGIEMAQVIGGVSLTREKQRKVIDVIIEAVDKYHDRFIGFTWTSPMWEERALEGMGSCCADLGPRGLS